MHLPGLFCALLPLPSIWNQIMAHISLLLSFAHHFHSAPHWPGSFSWSQQLRLCFVAADWQPPLIVCLSCSDEHFPFLSNLVYKHSVMALLYKDWAYRHSLRVWPSCRLDWVRLIPESFAKNIEFQCVDWVSRLTCSFVSTVQVLPVAVEGFSFTPSADVMQTLNSHTVHVWDLQCWAAPWVAACARCAQAGLDSCPARPRSGPRWAAPPGRSAPSHPSPGPPPGSPTGTGSPPASAAAHACPAPAPRGGKTQYYIHSA